MMEEVRQLLQEEGREARNLLAFHVSVDAPTARVARKPPRAGPALRRVPSRAPPTRLRSASAGRDKRSEFRARYWALLFGDLQRAVGEIYTTVEAHENLSECQEVILVLENYTRDFKALCEWFRLKWEYDNTPPPQRPQSLAWEIRKTDFVRPESRKAQSVRSSPSVSGKNSPSLSGHNTPSGKNSPSPLTGKTSPGSGKISPRISNSTTSPKSNIEFFSNKISGKVTAIPEPKNGKEVSRLCDIKEKISNEDIKSENSVEEKLNLDVEKENNYESESQIKDHPTISVELGTAKEIRNDASPKPVLVKYPKDKKEVDSTDTKGVENLVSADDKIISSQAEITARVLDNMESEFLNKQIIVNQIKNENMLNEDMVKEIKTLDDSGVNEVILHNNDVSPHKVEVIVTVADIHEEKFNTIDENTPKRTTQSIKVDKIDDNDIVKEETTIVNKQDPKKCEVKPLQSESKPNVAKAAYSQAAAKPKPVSAGKVDTKPPIKTASGTTALSRSKTVVEIRPNTTQKNMKQFLKKNSNNKCSYPFNLTTGRTSLFESAATKSVSRKSSVSRNTQITPIDIRKQDPKKTCPKRPTSLKIDNKSDKIDNNKTALENLKDFEEYSSSDTMVTQIDMSRIESCESLKTLVPEDNIYRDSVTNSIEVLNVDGDKNDNEGWRTVKSRRLSRESKKHSKSHWANRFNQPSATTSLPTLNMLESPKQEVNSILDSKQTKFERAKSEQPPKEIVEVRDVKKQERSAKNSNAILRQKSDVTGLKTRTFKSKVLSKRADKVKDSPQSEDDSPDLRKNRLHSSLESLTTALARSQESTEEPFDFDKWKAEFKSTFKYLEEEDQMANHNEILKSADPSEMSEIAEMTSQIEENERKISLALDFQSEVDQRKLCAEEDNLNRQIRELQQVSDTDLDTETDDTETDAEILCEDAPSLGQSVSPIPENLGPLAASLEDQYEPALAGLSWAERMDTLATLEALVARYPGRAQQLHAKLSQGIRRRGSLQETLKRYQSKQARAEQQRLEFQCERSKKIHQLLARVEEVKVAKDQLIDEKRLRMERRLQKAAENRDQHLKDIVRKAHDEDEKLREIAFIKQLEAEHRRHDFLEQCTTHTARLRQMRRDRLSKLEQKAVRDAAVGARRLAIEAARKLHVQTLLVRRRERDARNEERKEQRKQERDDAAREKAEGVKSRLSALAAAAELEADALRSRIQHKQDASQLRLASRLQAIRTRAGPRTQTTSESQETPGCKESSLEESEQPEREFSKEKVKALKKKARKLKQKLLISGQLFEDTNTPVESILVVKPTSNKMCKVLSQINNIISPFVKPIFVEKYIKNENQSSAEQSKDNSEEKELGQQPMKTLEGIKECETNQVKVKSKKKSAKKPNTANIPVNHDSYNELAANNELTNKKDDVGKDDADVTILENDIKKQSKTKTKYSKKNAEIKSNYDKENNAASTVCIESQIKIDNINNKSSSINESVGTVILTKANYNKADATAETSENVKANTKSKKTNKKLSNGDINDHENINTHVKNDDKSKDNLIPTDKRKSADSLTSDSISKRKPKDENNSNVDTNKEVETNKKNKTNKKTDATNPVQNDNSVKKIKNNKKNKYLAEFMKAYSECSSESDKVRVNNNHLLDMTHLERTLNELHRIVEKLDKNAPEKILFQKVQGIRTMGYMLASAVDQQDSVNQLSNKALTTTIVIVSRVISGCKMSATYFLGTNGAVYTIRLLLQELEKDLTADRDAVLAMQLADCLSVAFDSVLCLTRIEVSGSAKDREEERNMVISMRQRTHSLISYLCCGGTISRTERAGEARESVHTLLTMCADLCKPSVFDVGPDRSLAVASLKAALGPSLAGARDEFCALFAGGAALKDTGGGFVRAARTTRLLRSLAELNHEIMQEAFSRGGWSLEFRAAAARLLSEHAPTDREDDPRNTVSLAGNQRLDQSLSETMVLDLIVLIGFFVVNNSQDQEGTVYGTWSAVKTLCNLPASWIVAEPHVHALLPTLVALMEDPGAAAVIAGELSCEMLDEYMESPDSVNVKLVQVIKEKRQKKSNSTQ